MVAQGAMVCGRGRNGRAAWILISVFLCFCFLISTEFRWVVVGGPVRHKGKPFRISLDYVDDEGGTAAATAAVDSFAMKNCTRGKLLYIPARCDYVTFSDAMQI